MNRQSNRVFKKTNDCVENSTGSRPTSATIVYIHNNSDCKWSEREQPNKTMRHFKLIEPACVR